MSDTEPARMIAVLLDADKVVVAGEEKQEEHIKGSDAGYVFGLCIHALFHAVHVIG